MAREGDGQGFCFALPPSLGLDPVKELARRFADVLYGAGFTTVVPMKSYEELEQAILKGDVGGSSRRGRAWRCERCGTAR